MIEVPPPSAVTLFLFDSTSGEHAELPSVAWRPVRPDRNASGRWHTAKRLEPGVFRLRAPLGEVEIGVWDRRYTWTKTTVNVRASESRFTLWIDRAYGVELRVKNGETTLPWTGGSPVSARMKAGPGRITSAGWGSGGRRFKVDRPGLYRFEITVPDGYEPVPDQEVWVELGRFTEHAVALRRKPSAPKRDGR